MEAHIVSRPGETALTREREKPALLSVGWTCIVSRSGETHTLSRPGETSPDSRSGETDTLSRAGETYYVSVSLYGRERVVMSPG